MKLHSLLLELGSCTWAMGVLATASNLPVLASCEMEIDLPTRMGQIQHEMLLV